MALSGASVVVQSAEPLAARVEDGLVLFSAAQGRYYSFDAITTAVWERLQHPIAVRDVCAHLRERFEVGPEECEADVIALLTDLERCGLVTLISAG